ncbi:alcohol dehydrogenase catalytic domain-containing protein [Sulfolobus sp. E5-1-F]|uniref:alcohol dehydrogenase catalytic domain-containing protein n=1 Tax=Sulfolobaceae TaxID=118883 RepID=UPI0012981978|nr:MULTISPECIES: alcohol dehydrogenase catalytic domain-containing protein [unclassified Sulfolobus]QGA53580.1 alcohol dehydrogenase catalytic domain-containing protein [Sulfolobus sp. E5-1-F]QGA68755.1 alcohol dehydrogenase catalytic domain-containing protein [Sulfolobus sp. E11-6]
MLAAILRSFGEGLSLENVREPSYGIILKVLATGLCHGDLHVMSGDWRYEIKIELPKILGHEIVGEVIKGNKNFEEGDKVLVYNSIGCGKCKYCVSRKYQYCERVKIVGLNIDGGFAEYVGVPTDNILLKVEGNPVELAPLADAGITAYSSTKGITDEDNVLIIGTGAVALFALQILKLRGARVTIIGHNKNKLGKAKELGADEVINIKDNSSIASEIKGFKFDYIIDYVGSDYTLSDSMWLLNSEGELRIVGEFGGVLTVPEQLLVLKGLKVRGILYGSFDDLVSVYKLYNEGKIRSIVNTYRLRNINMAVKDLREGKVIGRAVIVPP